MQVRTESAASKHRYLECACRDLSGLNGISRQHDIELIEYAIADTPQLLRKGQEEAINDRRFAESIYRAAVASGIMERVAYQDTIAEAG